MSNKQAILISGRQGSGKGIKARELAAAIGSHVEIDVHTLCNQFGLDSVMRERPAVLIVDELHSVDLEKYRARIKELITSETVMVNRKGQEPYECKSANLIFCTCDPGVLKAVDGDRRFRVIAL